ncbi:MAG: tripartite tricarboxylate transporter TctB family protein [Geminicoccaceae bacterium]|nr:tripartite tricarboxylate transporter TctB family protein [Geminicoccaceae bacterium]MCX8102204.1 tripartite tricarboxylate transporter TctB family protein [Geminicoccaceae bacterium]
MTAKRPRHPGELGLTLLLVAAVFVVGREAYRISGFAGPSSPGFGPLAMVAVVLAGLLVELVRLALARPAEREPLAVRARRFAAAVLPPPVLGAIALLVLYLIGLELLGFVIASFLFLAIAIGLLLHERPPLVRVLLALAVAAGTVASIRLLFQELFQVLLP